MDIARGGQFTSIPATYPADTYDDEDTLCLLGLNLNSFEIDDEWTLNTPAKVQQTAPQSAISFPYCFTFVGQGENI